MKYSGIGGQAVIEGIMMMNRNDYAVAVRRPDGEIEIKKDKYESITTKAKILSLPFIRGVFRFADSMILGMKTLTYSASFFEDDEEEDPKPKKTDEEEQKEKNSNELDMLDNFVFMEGAIENEQEDA